MTLLRLGRFLTWPYDAPSLKACSGSVSHRPQWPTPLAPILFSTWKSVTVLTTHFSPISQSTRVECGKKITLVVQGREALRKNRTIFYLEIAMCLSIRAFNSSFSCWNRFSLSTNAVLLSALVQMRTPTLIRCFRTAPENWCTRATPGAACLFQCQGGKMTTAASPHYSFL